MRKFLILFLISSSIIAMQHDNEKPFLNETEKRQYKAIREAIFEIDPTFKNKFTQQYPHCITINAIQMLAKHPKFELDIEVSKKQAQAVIEGIQYPITGNLADIIESYFDKIQPGFTLDDLNGLCYNNK